MDGWATWGHPKWLVMAVTDLFLIRVRRRLQESGNPSKFYTETQPRNLKPTKQISKGPAESDGWAPPSLAIGMSPKFQTHPGGVLLRATGFIPFHRFTNFAAIAKFAWLDVLGFSKVPLKNAGAGVSRSLFLPLAGVPKIIRFLIPSGTLVPVLDGFRVRCARFQLKHDRYSPPTLAWHLTGIRSLQEEIDLPRLLVGGRAL